MDRAERDFVEAIKLDSLVGDPVLHLGDVYLYRKEYVRAIEMLEYADKLTPGDPQVQKALAKAREGAALRGQGHSGTFPK